MASAVWNLFHQMDHCFSPLQRRFAGLHSHAANFREPIEMIWAPALDVAETAQGYLISARMPELAHGEVRVMVDKGVVTFSGEHRGRASEPGAHGIFVRSFSLPDDIGDGNVAALFKDGVLSVRLSRAVKIPATIEIRTN